MDLANFLTQEYRTSCFRDNISFFRAIHGLSSGLRHLHYFNESTSYLHGTHQDIKPSNVLVKGGDFILTDFGLSRLKAIQDDSKTPWKDATYEYGAPECRNEETFAQGHVNRASDIWSLGCIISEVMIYMGHGREGIQDYRDRRLTEGRYGKSRAFHDGECLKEQILEALLEAEEEANSAATSALLILLKEMFSKLRTDRPDSKKVETRLEIVVMKALVQDLLETIARLYSGTSVYKTNLRLESDRLRAWAGVLGVVTIPGRKATLTLQPLVPFNEVCDAIGGAMKMSDFSSIHNATELDNESLLAALRHCNNKIYSHLSEEVRTSADGLFTILSTTTADAESLSSIRDATLEQDLEYKDLGMTAAMKYMSLRHSRQSEELNPSLRIEHSLIELDIEDHDFKARPPIYWYSEGYLPDQMYQVLVEWRDYSHRLPLDINSKQFRERVEAMYCRIQGLVAILQQKPKPRNFRVLDCLGTCHDSKKNCFGIVYKFPNSERTPVRLHYLLQGGGSRELRVPHIGQRLTLAKTLAACVQSLHTSRWIHKDINSFNILFFPSEITRLLDEDYKSPYLVGFQHSREDEQNAFTRSSKFNSDAKKYQHPSYQEPSCPFKREFDFYSLGLVFLEIGVWKCLSNIYNKRPESTPSDLREQYIQDCNRHVLQRMGPTYHEVTLTCLQAESRFRGKEEDVAVDFQHDVVDKLESCRF